MGQGGSGRVRAVRVGQGGTKLKDNLFFTRFVRERGGWGQVRVGWLGRVMAVAARHMGG